MEEVIKIVRCNWCENIFPESSIKVLDDIEHCPECGMSGCLMDKGIYGETDDKELFPNLSQARDWEKLKKHFSIDILCDFENEIHDYECGVGNEDVEDYPTIIQWWEGLMGLQDLLDVYA